MKNKKDPRHIKRLVLVQKLFAYSFNVKMTYMNSTFQKIIENLNQIDTKIEKAAPVYPLEKITKIDVAILRLAIYEMCFLKEQPVKVIIDEAVELAKELGGETSPSFIN